MLKVSCKSFINQLGSKNIASLQCLRTLSTAPQQREVLHSINFIVWRLKLDSNWISEWKKLGMGKCEAIRIDSRSKCIAINSTLFARRWVFPLQTACFSRSYLDSNPPWVIIGIDFYDQTNLKFYLWNVDNRKGAIHKVRTFYGVENGVWQKRMVHTFWLPRGEGGSEIRNSERAQYLNGP